MNLDGLETFTVSQGLTVIRCYKHPGLDCYYIPEGDTVYIHSIGSRRDLLECYTLEEFIVAYYKGYENLFHNTFPPTQLFSDNFDMVDYYPTRG